MVEKGYNRKYRKWVDGDVFALQITQEKKYKGRYLIFIRYENPMWKECCDTSYRVKITKNKKMPKTLEEIEELEYIIVRTTDYANRLLPIDASQVDLIKERTQVKYYPDEYGNLNVYTFDIHFERKYLDILDRLIYLGNFNLKAPEKEFIPFDRHNAGYYLLRNLEKYLISEYERYNLKKSPIYDNKYKKQVDEKDTFIPPDPKRILEVMRMFGIDFDEERKTKNSLTYVGGEEKELHKRNKNKD